VRVRERIEEDRRALAAAGRAATNLTFLDEQYRDQDQTLDPLADELAAMIEPGTLIYAPAALGAHADHLLVRAAALRLRASGHPVALYADLPHASARGWPSWVRSSGAQDSQDLAGAFWDRALTGTQVGSPTVHRLGGEVLARKLAAVRAYATQLPALAEYSGRPLDDPEVLGYEVFWATAGPAHEEPRDRRYLPAR
jgi:LmbE family N-acetylglucosaminyl deacetylase